MPCLTIQHMRFPNSLPKSKPLHLKITAKLQARGSTFLSQNWNRYPFENSKQKHWIHFKRLQIKCCSSILARFSSNSANLIASSWLWDTYIPLQKKNKVWGKVNTRCLFQPFVHKDPSLEVKEIQLLKSMTPTENTHFLLLKGQEGMTTGSAWLVSKTVILTIGTTSKNLERTLLQYQLIRVTYTANITKGVLASKSYCISQCDTPNTLGIPCKILYPSVSSSKWKVKLSSSHTYIHLMSKRSCKITSFSSSSFHSLGLSSDFKWPRGSVCSDSVFNGILSVQSISALQKLKAPIRNIRKWFSSALIWPLF